MIQALANKITSYMNKLNVLNESVEIHRYGIEVLISISFSFSLIILLEIMTNKVFEAIVYCVGLGSIRKFCGGYHCDTYFDVLAYILCCL